MARNIVFKVSADTAGVVTGMNQASKATNTATKQVNQLDQSLNKLTGAVAGAFAVGTLVNFAKEAAKVAAEVESIKIRLESIQGSTIAAEKSFFALKELANKLGLEFKGLASSYTQFVSAAKSSGLELSKAEKIFKSMSIAIAGSGASSEQANRAMVALVQMIGKGKISAEELRGQLGEAMPQAFGIMAKSLGVTTEKLDKMMANGELMAKDVLPKFAREMEKAFGKDAEKLANGLNASLNRLSNSWTDFLSQVGKSKIVSLSVDALTGAVNALGAAWATVTLNYASYETERDKQKRLRDADEETRGAQSRIQKEIEAYGDVKTAIEELTKKYIRLSSDIERYDSAVKRARNRIGGGNPELAFQTKEYDNKRKILSVLKEEIDLLNESNEVSVQETKLTDKQIKAIQREREERQKNIDLLRAWLLDPARKAELFVGATVPEYASKLGTGRDKQMSDEADSLKRFMDIERITRENAFNQELSNLDLQYQRKEIKEKEYLEGLKELRKRYNLDVTDIETKTILSDKERKEAQKSFAINMAGDTASAVTNTILAYKQKEISEEADMLAQQREQGVLSQDQYDQAIRTLKRKQAVADRIAAISQIVINTAIAISNPTNAVAGFALTPLYLANAAIQTGIVLAQPIPYNKGTKRVPMTRGAVRGRDSVNAILTPDERVVPADINTQPGYSALLDLAQDKKISDSEAGFIAKLATSGMRSNSTSSDIDPDILGRAIAKYIPHTNVAINDRGIAVITERSQSEVRRLRRRIG